MIQVMLVVEPKSDLGKELIEHYGTKWVVQNEQTKAAFNPNPGPWYLVAPKGHEHTKKNSRWVAYLSDRDFRIIKFIST